jgi:hypothetical protein
MFDMKIGVLKTSAEIGYHHKYENNCIPHTPDYFRRSLRPPQSSQKTVNVIHTTVTHNYQEEEEEYVGPLWSLCLFPKEEPDEFPRGTKGKSVLRLYGGHMARYIYEGYISF